MHYQECELFKLVISLVQKHSSWKAEIGYFEENEPGKHLSQAPFFNDMFA